MITITCPECKTVMHLKDADIAPGRSVRCPQCSVSVPIRGTKATRVTQESVDFPQSKIDETMLDLSDAIKAVRKKRKKD